MPKSRPTRMTRTSPDGFERAEKLATYIPATFEKPDFIFAAADSHESVPPRETVDRCRSRPGRRSTTQSQIRTT
jgi:hypothetical protein